MPPVTPQTPNSPSSQPVPPAGGSGLPSGFGNGIDQIQQQQNTQKLKTTEDKFKRVKVLWYITIGVAVIAVIVAIFFGVKYGSSELANKHKYDDGYKSGSDTQAQKDKDDAIRLGLADTRTYTASDELGAFSIEVPKTFSISTSGSGSDQLVLLANPDKVDTTAKYLAFHLTVKNQLFAKTRESYDRDAKSKQNGTSPAEDLKVDGRTAVRYTAKIDRRDKLGTVILVEVRDKTLIFQTDNNEDTTLLAAFNNIVGTARIP